MRKRTEIIVAAAIAALIMAAGSDAYGATDDSDRVARELAYRCISSKTEPLDILMLDTSLWMVMPHAARTKEFVMRNQPDYPWGHHASLRKDVATWPQDLQALMRENGEKLVFELRVLHDSLDEARGMMPGLRGDTFAAIVRDVLAGSGNCHQ